MNEFYYLKMFFKEFYSNRILPIKYFFQYSIFVPIKLAFMTKEQKEQYFIREQEERIKSMDNLMKSMFTGIVGGALTTAMMSSKLKKGDDSLKTETRKEVKR